MRTRVMGWWERLGSSYWFVPSVMVVSAVALSAATLALDHALGAGWTLPGVGGVDRPDGARTLLSTAAGSLITVAGVVFSMTLVGLSLASQQFGPRLVGNFMRDRGNQVVLGTFVATFVYCLLVLRTVRSADPLGESAAFVPQLSLGVALLLTLASLGVLLYFIHHTAESVQVSYVLARVSRALTAQILAFPEAPGEAPERRAGVAVGRFPHLGRPQERDATAEEAPAEDGGAREGTPQGAGGRPGAEELSALPDDFRSQAVTVRARRGGYVQSIDSAGLVALAREHDAVLRLHHPPGSLVMLDGPLADVYPAEAVDAVVGRIENHYLLGAVRTPSQDPYFLFDQLLEVAVRALSPGINDPLTANTCIDRIAEALNLLSRRQLPSPTLCDDDGTLRVVVPRPELAPLARHLFAELRAHGAGDPLVARHLAVTLRRMQASTTNAALERAAEAEVGRLLESAAGRLTHGDFEDLVASSRHVTAWIRLEA